MYFCCSFRYVSSLRAVLNFCVLAFVGFLLLSKDAIFMLSRFFRATRDSHGTLHLALGLAGMHSAVASMWVLTKFSYSSFGVCFQIYTEGYRICFLRLQYIYC